MKARISKREMQRAYGKRLINIGNGVMSSVFRFKPANYYSVRREGWACDYWEIDGLCFCDGDAPIGNELMVYAERKEWADAADRIMNERIDYEAKVKKVNHLLKDFIGTCKTRLEEKNKNVR